MRPESASAIDKLLDTVNSIKSELDSLKDITDMTTLGRLEDRIRQECQVIEALPGYMGQEIYKRIQIRRVEIREYNIAQIRNITEVTHGNTGANGDTGDRQGDADKPSGSKRKGNSKTRRSS